MYRVVQFAIVCICVHHLSAVEIFGLLAADYNPSPVAPWSPGWKANIGAGISAPLGKGLAVEALLTKRSDFRGSYVHFATTSDLTSILGQLAFNVRRNEKTEIFVFGGAGLLRFNEDIVLFHGPLPDDDTIHARTFNHFGVTTGIGTKVYMNDRFALRPEFRLTIDTADDYNNEGNWNVADIEKRFVTFSIGIVFAPSILPDGAQRIINWQ